MMTNMSVCRGGSFSLCKKMFLPCWMAGLFLGTTTAYASARFLDSMLHSAISNQPSLSTLIGSAVLPFLLSTVVFFLSEPWLLLPICLMKAFGFGFCAFSVLLAFGSAGWLVRFLFLFTDVFVVPVFLFYCLYQLRRGTFFNFRVTSAFAAVASMVAAADYYLIAPYLVSVIDF